MEAIAAVASITTKSDRQRIEESIEVASILPMFLPRKF